MKTIKTPTAEKISPMIKNFPKLNPVAASFVTNVTELADVPFGFTKTVKSCFTEDWSESETWIENGNDPLIVGLPEITPVEGSRPNPGGRDPDTTDQENGGVPDCVCNVEVYGIPTVPPGRVDVEIPIFNSTRAFTSAAPIGLPKPVAMS
jgi:hypothetical protein